MFIAANKLATTKLLMVFIFSVAAIGLFTGGYAQAQIDDFPATLNGTIDEDNIADWIQIEGIAHWYIEIEMKRTSGDLDPKLWLLDENEEVLAINDDYAGTLNSRILFNLPEAGEYTIVAAASGGEDLDTSGDYELSINLFPGFTQSLGIGTQIYLSSSSSGQAGTISYQDEDILVYNVDAQRWSMYFDGSRVGLGGTNVDVDAFAIISDEMFEMEDDMLLLSLNRETNVPGIDEPVDDSDILLFIPDRLGSATSGNFYLLLDGSDLQLGSSQEDIDAISFAEFDDTFWLVISTLGDFELDGLSGEGQDLLIYDPFTVGEDSEGRFKLYFDGSDVGLDSTGENISGLTIDSSFRLGDINYFTTTGVYDVGSQSGEGNDIFSCRPTSLNARTRCEFKANKEWNGSASGLTSGFIDGIHIEKPNF